MMTEAPTVAHPAKYSVAILEAMARELVSDAEARSIPVTSYEVLDPFAGVGRIHLLHPPFRTFGIELEPEWAYQHPRNTVGDATELPFPDEDMDAICVSPCYGNRFSDHHRARDSSKRRSYTHTLGRKLTKGSAGDMPYRNIQSKHAPYRALHVKAWREAVRVLRPTGIFLLNVSDFIANGEVQCVSAFHAHTLIALGLVMEHRTDIETPRMRHGANHRARVDCEHVLRFRKPSPPTEKGPDQ